MSADLPEPLIGPEVDLRSFTFMPLDVARLRDSDIAAIVSAEAFRAAVLLWCAAWHQLPAASLPSDDMSLARLSGFGRDMAGWCAVKEEALRGFVLCRDRRFYHSVIVEKAGAAWAAKQAQKSKTEAATAARKAKYEARQRDVDRDERRDDARHVHQQRGEERKGEKISSSLRSEETRAGAAQAKPKSKPVRRHTFPPDAFERWWTAYPHKVGKGAADKAFAKVRSADAVAFGDLLEAIDRYRRTKPAEREWCNPATWLNQGRWTDEPCAAGAAVAGDEEEKIDFGGGVRWPKTTVRAMVDRWRRDPGSWPEATLGPPPGSPGCKVPADLLMVAA